MYDIHIDDLSLCIGDEIRQFENLSRFDCIIHNNIFLSD